LKEFNNILLISGTGRNVGKTFFSCLLIDKFKENNLIGLKISPHFHDIDNEENIFYKTNNFIILKETKTNGIKDSSKMFISGSKSVFYIQAKDENIFKAFQYLNENYIKNQPVVCESAALGKFIIPSVHFVITSDNQISIKKNIPDSKSIVIVKNQNNMFQFDFERIKLIDNKWNFD